MGSLVTTEAVAAAARELGLSGRPLGLHVSLRSFGGLQDGPRTLLDGLLSEGCTVMLPTFSEDVFSAPPPPNDRPARNGSDYTRVDWRAGSAVPSVYSPDRTETSPAYGHMSAFVASHPHRLRSRSPTGSFAAVGPHARALIVDADEPEADDFGPLRGLCSGGGFVVMMGVDLTHMTLIHLAEVVAGRKPFIRWAHAPAASVVRVREGGCSEGFGKLDSVLVSIERRATVGGSLWRAFPAGRAVALAAEAIRRDPMITHCGDSDCIRCDDAVAGGPLE